jgi:hypothetical protein
MGKLTACKPEWRRKTEQADWLIRLQLPEQFFNIRTAELAYQ